MKLEPVLLGSKNPVYDWVKKMKLNLLKKILSVVITTVFLIGFNAIPANALTDGFYDCKDGARTGRTSDYFVITNNVVMSNVCTAGPVIITIGVTGIGNNAFANNTNITAVTIPNTVTTIGNNAFFGAWNIASATIPDSVTTIGSGAFASVFELTSISIPASVTSIGENAFFSTTGVQSFTVDANNPNYASVDGVLFNKNITTLISYSLGKRISGANVPSYTIPDTVVTLDVESFHSSFYLDSIIIPGSVTNIARRAFENSTLYSAEFLGNAPTIGTDSFNDFYFSPVARITQCATGFPGNGQRWPSDSTDPDGFTIQVVNSNSCSDNSNNNSNDNSSSSTKTSSTTVNPITVKNPDAVFNLKNKKYLSKDAMKTKLSKNKSFKRNPEDLYKYSIFKASKKTCAIQGNYVTSLKKTGTCDLYATRTTTKGVKYKYWVQINYTK